MTMAAAAAAEKPAGVCGGDGCDVRDSRPLHKIHHRGTLWRLCSSCVLKYSTGSFCALCFSLLDARPPAIVRCAKCPSISHRSCLRNPNLAFICPSCKNPEGTRKLIDAGSKKVLLAAARLAANSMKKAAAAERAEADMKVEAAVKARKRAREMLERALVVCKREREREKNAAAAAEEPKRKFGEQKRAGSREIEKWMRVHEPIPMMMGQVKDEKVELKGVAQAEVRARVASNLGQDEKDMKGILLSPESIGVVKKEERSLPGGGEKGPRLPKSTQDELVSRANSRSLFTGSPSIARLNS